jgi:hypothetical protein
MSGHFRIASSPKLVWIEDEDGNEILPWGAFDGMSPRKASALARKIVEAVNRLVLSETGGSNGL